MHWKNDKFLSYESMAAFGRKGQDGICRLRALK